MLKRLLTAFVGIPVIILTLFLWGGRLFAVVVGLLSLLGAEEYFRAVKDAKRGRPLVSLGLLACGALFAAAWYQFPRTAVLTGFTLLALIAEIFRPNREPIADLGSLLTGVLYVGWLGSFLIQMGRNFSGSLQISGIPGTLNKGIVLLLFSLAMIWATDSAAFFVGKFLGRHKLCPSLSPGKTIEGSIGGFFGAILVAILFGKWFHLAMIHCLIMGILSGIFAQLGDLAESAMKRDLGIKDFGSFFPGHGGVLDRMDSLLVAIPVLYIYARLLWPLW